jgi:hypothetical protein
VDLRHVTTIEDLSPAEGVAFIQATTPVLYTSDKGKKGIGYVSQYLDAAGYPQMTTTLIRKGEVEANHTIGGKEVTSPADTTIVPNHDQIIGCLHMAVRYLLDEVASLKQAAVKKE